MQINVVSISPEQRENYSNMAELNKPKLQLRSSSSTNGDKTLSPAAKLLINHGKPNFTIQRSQKSQYGNINTLSPTPKVTARNNYTNYYDDNNNGFVIKSTTFNGVFKPSNISTAAKQTLHQNGNGNGSITTSNSTENEAAKVVLRRAKVEQNEIRMFEDEENVPEFIRRQRRIQERLANQNILDFENRRSGYFTQVLISPSSPNRQSFAETMASPAIKPGLEIPSPTAQNEQIAEEETTEEQQEQTFVERSVETIVYAEPVTLTAPDEEEEVAKAIEEVNKAVEGEDDDKTEMDEHVLYDEHTEQKIQPTVVAVTVEHVKETKLEEEEETLRESEFFEEPAKEDEDKTKKIAKEHSASENENAEEVVLLQNGHAKSCDEITISHTNCLNGPTLPSPDPRGEKGVNYEPKTVVSFSQELGNDVNKYPDTVKLITDTAAPDVQPNKELSELSKLKFEIKGDDKDIEVKPILIDEAA